MAIGLNYNNKRAVCQSSENKLCQSPSYSITTSTLSLSLSLFSLSQTFLFISPSPLSKASGTLSTYPKMFSIHHATLNSPFFKWFSSQELLLFIFPHKLYFFLVLLNIVSCWGEEQLGVLCPGCPQEVPLRLRLESLFYSPKVPLK